MISCGALAKYQLGYYSKNTVSNRIHSYWSVLRQAFQVSLCVTKDAEPARKRLIWNFGDIKCFLAFSIALGLNDNTDKMMGQWQDNPILPTPWMPDLLVRWSSLDYAWAFWSLGALFDSKRAASAWNPPSGMAILSQLSPFRRRDSDEAILRFTLEKAGRSALIGSYP